MNKVLVGLIVGALLGAVDGATAWFTPQVRDQILSIVFFSTIKGIIAGVAAGWFARKVQSVPKGIAFGFAVGLLLAFAVAAAPDPNTGEHYWWQIMVPGSILGGVIGWTTQRYGRPGVARHAAAAMTMLALVFAGVPAWGGEHDHAAPGARPAAFDQLKALAGSHKANMMTSEGQITTVEYSLMSGGTTVQERLFVGEPHEMVTMYTADGDGVLATHYCSGGNQPTLRLNTAKSSADTLVFDFVKVTGQVTPNHINGVSFRFDEKGRVEQVWLAEGKGEYVKLFFAAK